MKIKSIYILLIIVCLGCSDSYLDVFPEDKITSANFPENEKDIKFDLNGVYSLLKENSIFNEGLYGFGVLDGATPNAYNWGNTSIARIGSGQLSSSDDQIITFRWTRCYAIIFRANSLLKDLEKMELSADARKTYEGEAHFLRGLAYSLLADSYGGVPIITAVITADDAKSLKRASLAETWNQVISDYDVAIANLAVKAPEVGRADKGAALAMKMRAYLYQNKFDKVLEVTSQIEALNKYSLFSSYEGLFKKANENNKEVIFDIQYIRGENSQGSLHDQYCGTGTGSFTRGTRYVPTDDLVNAYETVDGSAVDAANPYKNRDPRLGFTVVVPGSFILGYQFPNYIYPGGAYNHPGNRLKHLSCRKYRENDMANLPTSGQSEINNIVIRYADVVLAKAEALIELNQDIPQAIELINKVRTERTDVKITKISSSLSQSEARAKLRHERRIEFALEGLYWSDIKRWKIGKDIYPLVVKDHLGGVIETRFPNGYLEYYNLLPIPAGEISLNPELEQNPNW
jgi:hypothetical protein